MQRLSYLSFLLQLQPHCGFKFAVSLGRDASIGPSGHFLRGENSRHGSPDPDLDLNEHQMLKTLSCSGLSQSRDSL